MKQKAEQFGNEVRDQSGSLRKDISSVPIPRQGIGHAIGVLFKAFFLFISVIITFALVTALIGLIFTGAGVLPLKNFFIHGFWQNILAWSVLLLFLVLPVIGLLTWLIRRIIGARRGGNYLGYIFGSLWVIGLISLFALAASISSNFRTRAGVSEDIRLTAPAGGRMIVKMDDSKPVYFDSDWMGINWHNNGPFFDLTEDSLTMNTVRINLIKSNDSSWHLHREKLSRGSSNAEASSLASQIEFPIEQRDSLLLLAHGFSISPKQQFRNQQVLLVLEIPVGKKILMSPNLDDYHWFDINRKRWNNRGMDVEWNVSGDYESSWDAGSEYIMTENGLERTHKNMLKNQDEDEDRPVRPDSSENKNPNGEYRYHKSKTAAAAANIPVPAAIMEKHDPEFSTILVLLTQLG
ncbi:MAG TPA: hypothetical protein DIC22_06790 [Chitinophagaceae bacterium]|nr:hypothetical protein [Chitinophagaceae bacterium]